MLGILFVCLSSFLFAPLVQASSKYLALAFPVLQILWVRMVGQTLWMLAIFWRSHGLSIFRTKHPVIQITRSLLMLGCTGAWLFAIPKVPLATAAAIMFTTPIFVAMLSVPMLGERVGVHRGAAIGAGFLGAIIMIRPGEAGVPVELLLVVLAAFWYAIYQILTRKVAAEDGAATSALYAVLVGAVVATIVVAPADYAAPPLGEWHYWLGFLAVGFLGGVRHLFMVKAFEQAPASVISPFCYTELIGVSVIGIFWFGEFPDAWTGMGATIIVGSGLYIAHRERRLSQA